MSGETQELYNQKLKVSSVVYLLHVPFASSHYTLRLTVLSFTGNSYVWPWFVTYH